MCFVTVLAAMLAFAAMVVLVAMMVPVPMAVFIPMVVRMAVLLRGGRRKSPGQVVADGLLRVGLGGLHHGDLPGRQALDEARPRTTHNQHAHGIERVGAFAVKLVKDKLLGKLDPVDLRGL